MKTVTNLLAAGKVRYNFQNFDTLGSSSVKDLQCYLPDIQSASITRSLYSVNMGLWAHLALDIRYSDIHCTYASQVKSSLVRTATYPLAVASMGDGMHLNNPPGLF